MKKASRDVLEGIVRLRSNENFRKIIEWIRESKNIAFIEAVNTNKDTDIFRGRAHELNDLVETVDTALKVLDNFKP